MRPFIAIILLTAAVLFAVALRLALIPPKPPQQSAPPAAEHLPVRRTDASQHAFFPPGATVRVKALGHEYEWLYRVAGPDEQFGTADDTRSRGELLLPLDRDVRISVTSDDFVYYYSVPELGLRRVAVPELNYSLDFHTTKAGVFEVKTDPLCGARLFHGDTMGQVIVQPTNPENASRPTPASESRQGADTNR